MSNMSNSNLMVLEKKGNLTIDTSGKITIIVDSTQLNDFLTCPTLWDLSDNQNIIRVDLGPKRALIMGTYGHKLVELYYKNRATGMAIADCIELSLAFDPYTAAAINGDKFDFPLESYLLIRQRFTEYCYTYSNSDFTVKDPEDVEIGFSKLIHEDSDRRYILEGRIDLLGIMSGLDIFIDHKYQERASNLYKKSIQFRNYALVTQRAIGLINYIRVNKSISKDTFCRDLISFSKPELAAWHDELIGHFKKIEDYLLDTENHGTAKYLNRSSCSGRYGYPCEFTPICEETINDIKEAKKTTLYTIKEEWKPW